MSNMEPEAQDFLQRVIWSVFIGLVWMFINMTAGIFGGWLFYDERPTLGNIIFYSWFLISSIAMIYGQYKIWKKRFPHG